MQDQQKAPVLVSHDIREPLRPTIPPERPCGDGCRTWFPMPTNLVRPAGWRAVGHRWPLGLAMWSCALIFQHRAHDKWAVIGARTASGDLEGRSAALSHALSHAAGGRPPHCPGGHRAIEREREVVGVRSCSGAARPQAGQPTVRFSRTPVWGGGTPAIPNAAMRPLVWGGVGEKVVALICTAWRSWVCSSAALCGKSPAARADRFMWRSARKSACLSRSGSSCLGPSRASAPCHVCWHAAVRRVTYPFFSMQLEVRSASCRVLVTRSWGMSLCYDSLLRTCSRFSS